MLISTIAEKDYAQMVTGKHSTAHRMTELNQQEFQWLNHTETMEMVAKMDHVKLI